MHSLRKSSLIVASVGALLLGGGVLATVAFGATGHSKKDAAPKAATTTGSTTAGAFRSNEDPAHEAGESAEVEAQEDSGSASARRSQRGVEAKRGSGARSG